MALTMSPSEIQSQLAHIHDNKSRHIITSGAISLSVAIVAVILRLISRRLSRARSMLMDDYLIIGALIFEIGEVITQFICVHYGEGRHAVSLTHPLTFGKLLIATSCMYIVAIAMVKISVLFFYRRIFPSRRFLIILRIVGGFIMCYSTVQLLVFVFECIPIRGAWDPLIQAKCIHVNDMFIAMSAFDVLTGVMTLCLPIPLIWQLHVSKRSKIHLMGIFILGGSFCTMSILRLIKVCEQVSLVDISYTNADTQIWSVAEVCIAIICACLPTIRPLFDPRVRKNSFKKKVPKVNDLERDPTAAGKMPCTGITVRESISIEMEPYVSSDRPQNSTEIGQGHADFQTLVRSDWQMPTYVKI